MLAAEPPSAVQGPPSSAGREKEVSGVQKIELGHKYW